MGSLLRVSIGVVLALGAVIAAGAPASAATPASATLTARLGSQVTGEAWSSPAFPVSCDRQENLISCTPNDPNQVKPTACFLDVIVDGQNATVCTTFAGHQDAIKAAGGVPATVDFGCSFGDIVCGTFQNWGIGAAMIATALMYSVLSVAKFDVGGSLWNAAAGQWSFWAWATLIVVFGAMIWSITAAVISGDRSQLVSALVRSFFAIPAVPLTFWLTGQLVQSIDGLTQDIVGQGAGAGGLFGTLQAAMWAGGQAGYVFGFAIFGLIFVGMLLLLAVFLFRNVALAALIMVGPIAWMMFPARGVGPQWVVRYVSAVVVLLLTGPLTIAFFSLVVHGLAAVKTIWDPAAWPYIVGLLVIAFAPFAVFGLFSFVGAVAVDSIGSRLGGHAAAMGSRAARTAASIPTRVGSIPAGVPSAQRPPVAKSSPSARATAGSSRATPPARRSSSSAPTSTPAKTAQANESMAKPLPDQSHPAPTPRRAHR